MQLSVSTPPTDPTLAALLLAGVSPATVAPDTAVLNGSGFDAVLDGTETASEESHDFSFADRPSAGADGDVATAALLAGWSLPAPVATTVSVPTQPLTQTNSEEEPDILSGPGNARSARPSLRGPVAGKSVSQPPTQAPAATPHPIAERSSTDSQTVMPPSPLDVPTAGEPAKTSEPEARTAQPVLRHHSAITAKTVGQITAGANQQILATPPSTISGQSWESDTNAFSTADHSRASRGFAPVATGEMQTLEPGSGTPSPSDAVVAPRSESSLHASGQFRPVSVPTDLPLHGNGQAIVAADAPPLIGGEIVMTDIPLSLRSPAFGVQTSMVSDSAAVRSPRTGSASPFSSSATSALSEWPLTGAPEERRSLGRMSRNPFTSETITSAHQLGAKTTGTPPGASEVIGANHQAGISPATPVSATAPMTSPSQPAIIPTSQSPSGVARFSDEVAPVEQVAVREAVSTSALHAPASPSAAMTLPVEREQRDSSAKPVRPAMLSTQSPEGFQVRGEKIAAERPRPSDAPVQPKDEPVKTFVSSINKRVTSDVAALGTSVAKPTDAMLSASTLPPPSALDHDTVALEAAPATEVSFDLSVESDVAPETMNTAHRAVEAVLTAVHRFSSKDHQAVNLQFTVGGSDLSVRVEMRADEVRATFTTDSAELRAALSHEWQSAQPPASDRPLKLAAPNFVSNDAANTGSSPGQNFSRQRDAGVHAGAEPFSLIAPRTRAARGAGFDTPSAVNAPRIPHRNSLHLHTLA